MLKISSRGDTTRKAVLSCQSPLRFQEPAGHNFGPTKKYVDEMLQQIQKNVKSMEGRRTRSGDFEKRAVKKCGCAHELNFTQRHLMWQQQKCFRRKPESLFGGPTRSFIRAMPLSE